MASSRGARSSDGSRHQAKTTQVVAMYFTPSLEPGGPVLVGPEGREQDQLALLRSHAHVLIEKLGLPAGSGHVVEIPQGHQLALTELVAAAVHVPVVILAGPVALHLVALVLEGTLEVGEGLAKLLDGGREGAEEHLVHVLPVGLVAHHQIRGALDARVLGAQLPHAARVLMLGMGLEALDHRVAERGGQGQRALEDQAQGLHLADGGERREGAFGGVHGRINLR